MTQARELASYDVAVVGAGTAGVMAAISAARNGAKTCLVESSGYLGGTTYALGNVVGFHNNRMEQVVAGVPQLFIERLRAGGGVVGEGHLPNPGGMGGTVTLMDSSVFNMAAFEMAREAGVDLMLHTFVTGVLMEGRQVTGLRIVNKSGEHHLPCRAVVDASGDADVAVAAGSEVEKDQPGRGLSATSVYRLGDVDHQAFVDDLRAHPHKMILLEDEFLKARGRSAAEVMAEQVRTVYDLPYIYLSNLVRDYVPRADWAEWDITSEDKSGWGRLKPFGSRVHLSASAASPSILYVNTTNVHFDATDAAQLSEAEVEAQRQVKLSMDVLRRYVPGFRQATYLGSMPKISVRASRRIIGDRRLEREDVVEGRHVPDAIARGCYPMSIQSETQANVRHHVYVRDGGDYGIPYGCLLPRGVEGLLVAGRCISGTREASGSMRTGAQCMAYGHAAGTAASMAAREGVTPRALDVGRLRERLQAEGALV